MCATTTPPASKYVFTCESKFVAVFPPYKEID
jgi:hypothetical protein